MDRFYAWFSPTSTSTAALSTPSPLPPPPPPPSAAHLSHPKSPTLPQNDLFNGDASLSPTSTTAYLSSISSTQDAPVKIIPRNSTSWQSSTQGQPPSASAAPAQRPESANALPPSLSQSTAGAHVRPATFTDAVQAVKLQDFTEAHKKPCVRDALLTGIGAGFVAGPVFTCCSWAVAAFSIMSCGSYEFYQRKRQLEIGGMKRATEIMEKKKAERERQMDETRRLRRVRREDEERRKEAESRAKSGGWGLW